MVVQGAPSLYDVNNPSVINKQNTDRLKKLEIERKFIKNAPEEVKKEQEEKERMERSIENKASENEVIDNPPFVLNDIKFIGNTVYSDKKLKKFAKSILDKEIRLENISAYTAFIARYYQENGYLTSYAYLPSQEIDEDGIVTIVIVESKVKNKEIVGNFWGRKAYYKNFVLSGTHLNEGKVFNVSQMQGALKSLNRESWVQSGVFISQEPDEEDVTIGLDVSERFPVSFDVNVDNSGYANSGRERTTLVLGIDNLTGLGDKIYGGTTLSSGTKGALAGYQIPVSKYGTKLSYNFSKSVIEPGGPLRALGLRGEAISHSIGITHPLVNNRFTEVNAFASLDFINSKTDLTVFNFALSDYSLRVARTGVNFMHDDSSGRWLGSAGVDFGINALGATKNLDTGPQSKFYKLNGGLTRVQGITDNIMGIARVNAQYSPQALYTTEQMYLGGAYSVRGYEPSTLLGDYGVNGSIEVRLPVPFLGRVLPEKLKFIDDNVRIAPFYDWGYVKENKNVYQYPQNFIQSAGVALYIWLKDAISVQIGVGFPLGHKYYNENSARLFFSVSTEVDKLFLKPKKRSEEL